MPSCHRGSLVLVLVLIGFASTAFAQALPRSEVSGGWQMLRAEDDTVPGGWYAEFASNLNRTFALVGRVDGLYETIENSAQAGTVIVTVTGKSRMHTALGGARVNVTAIPRVVPFVEVLAGAAHLSATLTTTVPGFFGPSTEDASRTEPVVQLGGGVTISLSRALGLRIAVDHRRIFLDGETGKATRVATGLVWRF